VVKHFSQAFLYARILSSRPLNRLVDDENEIMWAQGPSLVDLSGGKPDL
jgi:hypothetical protein